jgi:hypothetical protein
MRSFSGLAAIYMLLGCGNEPPPSAVCTPGATASCVCTDGRSGAQTCRSDGSGFTACVCEGGADGGMPVCAPSTTRACTCSGGRSGTEECLLDGSGYTACFCPDPLGCTVRETTDAEGVFIATDDCAGDQICICPSGSAGTCEASGTCSIAFGRRYRLAPLQATVPERSPTGECWDPGCGLPDLFAIGSIDGTTVVTTVAATDSLGAIWSGAVGDGTVAAGSTVRFDVYDDDTGLDSPDPALGCAAEPISAAMLRSRRLACSGALGTFLGAIVPL